MNWPTMTYDIVQAGRDLGISHSSSGGNNVNPAPKPKVYDAPQERPGYKAPIDRVAKRESVMEYLERQARESRALQEATVANANLKSTEEVLEGCWIACNGEDVQLPHGTRIECLFRSGAKAKGSTTGLRWSHREDPADVVAYRIIA